MKNNNRILNSLYLGIDGIFDALVPNNSTHILIACMPKSASTFLATALSELPKFKRYRLIPDWGVQEQQLSCTRLSRYNRKNYIAQHHVRNSYWTQKLIKQYRITPVVLVRDFADTVISIKNHTLQWPTSATQIDKSYQEIPAEDLDEAIVRLTLPWYFSFYSGWRASKNVPIFDFDDYTTKPVKTIREIITKADMLFPDEAIENAIGSAKNKFTRFNIGESGRGRNLSPKAKEALMRMMELYPKLQNDPLFVKTAQTISTPSD